MWCCFTQSAVEKPCGFCMVVLQFPLWSPYLTLEILVVWQFISGWKRQKRSEYLSPLVLSLCLFSLFLEKLEVSFACHELGGNWNAGIMETSGNMMMQNVLFADSEQAWCDSTRNLESKWTESRGQPQKYHKSGKIIDKETLTVTIVSPQFALCDCPGKDSVPLL